MLEYQIRVFGFFWSFLQKLNIQFMLLTSWLQQLIFFSRSFASSSMRLVALSLSCGGRNDDRIIFDSFQIFNMEFYWPFFVFCFLFSFCKHFCLLSATNLQCFKVVVWLDSRLSETGRLTIPSCTAVLRL